MALKYRLLQKINPRTPEAPGKFYAQSITTGDVKLRQLAKEIAEISTVNIVDIMAVIESFIQLIPRHIGQGQIVRLGEFGSFYVGISSKGAEQETDFKESMIKKVKIYFRPGSVLKKEISALEFEKQS